MMSEKQVQKFYTGDLSQLQVKINIFRLKSFNLGWFSISFLS